MMATGAVFEVLEVGVRTPKEVKKDCLIAGEVGYIAAAIKTVKDVRVGDTITLEDNSAVEPLPGYRELKSMVFCGLYPVNAEDYQTLKDSFRKVKIK